jgi:hypothetical protein
LRGRILDLLRDAPAGAWATIEAPLGEHGSVAIDAALAALRTDGLAELHPRTPRMARLPLA